MITKKESKVEMIKALKDFVAPEIKILGFLGTFPHFRRQKNDRYEFVSFQFNRHGGSFVLECAFIKPTALAGVAKELPFEKLNHSHTPVNHRFRIKSEKGSEDDSWFSYSEFNSTEQFAQLAQSLKPLLLKIENFFQN
jgi:hypothetical protein